MIIIPFYLIVFYLLAFRILARYQVSDIDEQKAVHLQKRCTGLPGTPHMLPHLVGIQVVASTL